MMPLLALKYYKYTSSAISPRMKLLTKTKSKSPGADRWGGVAKNRLKYIVNLER